MNHDTKINSMIFVHNKYPEKERPYRDEVKDTVRYMKEVVEEKVEIPLMRKLEKIKITAQLLFLPFLGSAIRVTKKRNENLTE